MTFSYLPGLIRYYIQSRNPEEKRINHYFTLFFPGCTSILALFTQFQMKRKKLKDHSVVQALIVYRLYLLDHH
jgi:hypothetical protein